MCTAKTYAILALTALLIASAGCGLLATVTPGPESISTPEPTAAATETPTATPTPQVALSRDIPQTVEAPTPTHEPLPVVVLEPTVAATATPAPPTTISECTPDTLQDPPAAYAEIIDLLTELWIVDAELCTAVAQQPWAIGQGHQFGGGTIEQRRLVLESLRRLGSADPETAKSVTNIFWFAAGLTYMHARAFHELSHISTEDSELVRMVASSGWFTIGNFDATKLSIALADFRRSGLISTHVELARVIARQWLEGDIPVIIPFGAISNVAAADIELAMRIAALPWLADGLGRDGWEASAIVGLGDLASADIELVRQIASLSWFVDGIDSEESEAIERLATLAFDDVEAARQIVASSWFTDGIDYNDRDMI